MERNRFSGATVMSIRNGRVVLKEQDGRHTKFQTKDDPDKISLTVIEEPNPTLQSASNPSAENSVESL